MAEKVEFEELWGKEEWMESFGLSVRMEFPC